MDPELPQSESESSGSASSVSIISRHLFRVQQQVNRAQSVLRQAQASIRAQQRTLDTIEVRQANIHQAFLAALYSVLAILQLLRVFL